MAVHYGFTDEELDFIINYDTKYRMGRDEIAIIEESLQEKAGSAIGGDEPAVEENQ